MISNTLRHSKYKLLIILSFILFTPALAQQPAIKKGDQVNVQLQLQKLSEAFNAIGKYYVDTINYDTIVETAINEMLKKLDPHSIYINKKDVNAMNSPLQGSFEGIGIYYNILNDTALIISPIAGSPSDKAGILPGDRIIKINSVDITGTTITIQKIKEHIVGKMGEPVELTVKRIELPEPFTVTVIRDKIPIYSIEAVYMLTNNIGYIRLNRFSATSLQEFRSSLSRLQSEGMESLVLDLQGNSGGYLNAAIELSDEFLENKELIVYTEGISSPRRNYYGKSNDMFEKGKLVLIIDEGSASASEILAGAIQDWDRGLIIGRRSFGKGLVQRPFTLPDGSMIRLTTARYYTPTGRSIQKPYVADYGDYRNDLLNRWNTGELISADSIKVEVSQIFYTLNKKRKVYGGGGIIPDVFIPIDTSAFSNSYLNILKTGYLNKFVLAYVDKNRKFIKDNYTKFSVFQKEFEVSDPIMEQFLTELNAQKLAPKQYLPETMNRATLQQLKIQFKAVLARDLWTNQEFYEIINHSSPEILQAIELLNNSKLYKKSLTSDH